MVFFVFFSSCLAARPTRNFVCCLHLWLFGVVFMELEDKVDSGSAVGGAMVTFYGLFF